MPKFMPAIILFLTVLTAGTKYCCAQDDQFLCKEKIDLLLKAVRDTGSFFIKVHAAENLISQNVADGLDTVFLSLKKSSPDYVIGASRVLARLHKNNPGIYQQQINELLALFKYAKNSRSRLTALESLGKLGYNYPLPEITAYSNTGTHGFKAMARWVLSNDNSRNTENKLSELLLSHDILDYRYAAYALRFKQTANRLTRRRLKISFRRLSINDEARIYLASSSFVHGNKKKKDQLKQVLLSYLNGTVGQRYEVAEALGIGGSFKDLQVLQQLSKDENADVRVAAANAGLRLLQCRKQN